MKKSELKKVIKPLVKECINEILLEEGLLSGIVSEVAKGISPSPLVETARPKQDSIAQQPSKREVQEKRRKMMEAVNKDAYNGVNLFEGTEPLPTKQSAQGSVDMGDPRDPGVDISSIMGTSTKIWQAMK